MDALRYGVSLRVSETSERSERVGYRVEHEMKNSITVSNHVLFILYIIT